MSGMPIVNLDEITAKIERLRVEQEQRDLAAKAKAEPKPRKSKSANGAGGIRRRSDGTYEARLVVGYN